MGQLLPREKMLLSHWLDNVALAAANIGACIKEKERSPGLQLDPTTQFEWLAENVDVIRTELLEGKSTADLQREAAQREVAQRRKEQ